MGYILITQKKYGNASVTWNISKRVPDKKNPKRIATYLGLLNDNGNKLLRNSNEMEITPEIKAALKKKNISISTEYANPRGPKPVYLKHTSLRSIRDSFIQNVGTYRVLHALAEESGFLNSLTTTFTKDSESIFALMCQKLDSHLHNYLFQDWADDSPFKQVRLSMSPKSISNLLRRIEQHRLDFAKNWYQACGCPSKLIEDSTHFCTYASSTSHREKEEYGWDHHQEAGKRQINLMSLVAMDSHLPIMYRAYPGSINDIATFLETSAEMKVIGKDKKLLYVSDSGYFSNFNMLLMKQQQNDFIIEAKWNLQTLTMLKENSSKLKDSTQCIEHGRYVYSYAPCTYVLHDIKNKKNIAANGYIYYSNSEAGQLRDDMKRTILLWKKAFKKYDFCNKNQAQEWLDTSTENWGKYFNLITQDDIMKVEINNLLFNKDTKRFGFHVILSSNDKFSGEETLKICHGRDPIEKLWRLMKSDLTSRTLKTKLDETTQGQIFITWGAAILSRLLHNRIKNSLLNVSVNEALITMRKIRLFFVDNEKIPQTLTKKAKDLLVELNLTKYFLEFNEMFKTTLEKKKKIIKSKQLQEQRGRPRKFKLKTDNHKNIKDKKENNDLSINPPKKRGRPRKK